MKILEIKNRFATAKIALQGAHIFECRIENKELLFTSKKAHFIEGKAIRGGVPICWPYFGKSRFDSSLPQHGFARTSLFNYEGIEELEDGSSKVTLTLSNTPQTHTTFDYKFKLVCEITVGKKLTISLTTINKDSKAMPITQALHSYLQVDNIDEVKLLGLERTKYVDSLDNYFIKESTTPLEINKEIDRVYIQTEKTLKLQTPQRSILIEKSGSNSDVIWNPWIDKAKEMSDLADDEYKNFICIESANALKDERVIEPKCSHTLTQTLYFKESK